MDGRPECCRVEENLEVREQSQDRVLRVCRVCGRRHFEMSVDPIKVGLKILP